MPVVNRADLLLDAVFSIGYPVGKLFIIDNSGGSPSIHKAIRRIKSQIPETIVANMGANIGFSASINLGFKHSPAPWVMMANDVLVGSGALELMMAKHAEDPESIVVGADQGLIFALVAERAIRQVGYFDENFYPAYCEDCDWWRRLILSGAKTTMAEGAQVRHLGSQTILSDPDLARKNKITHRRNIAYYCRKWGGPPGQEAYDRPFGNPSAQIQDWQLDEKHYAANWNVWNA